MVSMPLTEVTLSPSKVNLLPSNLAVGESPALKKSLPFKCVSSGGTPVVIDAMSMVMSALPVLATGSIVIVPSFLSNRPRLVDVPMCLASQVTKVCKGSIA